MTESLSFQQVQHEFTERIRRPLAHNPLLPELEKRMTTYRRLLRHNMANFVDNIFPVTQALLPPALWRQLGEHFFEQGVCDSPFYYDISLHFKDHVATLDWPSLKAYPWLNELLHFEWLELFVEMGGELDDAHSPCQSSAELQIVCVCWPLIYHWPVHEWTKATKPSALQSRLSCLLVETNEQQRMRVREISAMTAFVIESIQQDSDLTSQKLLTALIEAHQLPLEVAQVQLKESMRWLTEHALLIQKN